jgi:SAM-dependent methyltransferase
MQDASSYDQVPYPNRPQRTAHPRHLEAVATLFGMRPQPSPQCTVLELGSATGANLIAQAYDLTDSKFLGIDFSETQIADGQKMVEKLGLRNIELRHANILDVDTTWGQFDYVICPGVYSWTPREVQDKIMAICQANLAPNGVAYVSYNVYPGWHLRTTIRDMMRYHVSRNADRQGQIDQARAILEFLAVSCQEDDDRVAMVRNELETVRRLNDAFFFHEYLEESNTPIYFHEFADRAQANGLQYLAEADVSLMFSTSLPEQAHATLEAMQNLPLIRREQYMDYARNRQFRATLLCREEITLQRQLKPAIMEKFYLNTTAHFEERNIDPNGMEDVEFSIGEGKLRTGRPLNKAAFSHLNV